MTYRLQPKPDESVELMDGSICTPAATLKDEYGGVSHIIIDDHCYVLVNGEDDQGRCAMVKHWFTEAVVALQGLPADPRKLEQSVPFVKFSPGDRLIAKLRRKGKPPT